MSIVRPICQPIVRPITRALTAGGGGGFVSIVTDGVLADFVTFTRASTGTYFDSAGVMQTAAIDTPRIDYNPATLALRGLLVEEQRTNLLLRSQEFDNASWGKSSGGTGTVPVVTANAATAPDGTATAERVTFGRGAGTGSGDYSIISQSLATTPQSYTGSVFVRSATGLTQNVMVYVAQGSSVAAAVMAVGNDWVRIPVTLAFPGSATGGFTIGTRGGTYGGDQTLDLYVWGAQLEVGSFATSYIPTTTATVTRAIDDPDFTIPSGIVRLKYTYDDDTTADVAVTPGAAYQIPTGQKRIKTLRGYRS